MADDQIEARRAKLALLRESGRNPYPDRWHRTHSLLDARVLPDGTDGIAVAGRVLAKREISKKLVFLTLQDRSGKMQLSFRAGSLPDDAMDLMRKTLDVGDFLGVRGKVWITKTGEPTVDAAEATILAKGLRPLPEKWQGLQDRESCYRQRYLDLMTNEETRARFRLRTKLVRAIREHLDAHGFEEVDTPILQTKASGALARPFLSHHNALDMEVTLRIAPETWLKRLVVGGYERVYEFARCFRNEGMDPSHLQDFTMLEYYVAYWSYEDNMRFTEHLVKHVVEQCLGKTTVRRPSASGDEVEIDFSGDWPRRRITDLIRERTGVDVVADRDPEALRAWIREHGHAEDLGRGELAKMAWPSLVDHLYKKTVRPHLLQPVFVVGHPIELSPLARRNDADPSVTDRFQLVVNSWEIVNA